jgi:uncharacterized protein YhjY with autotransporter beta-barrel domain
MSGRTSQRALRLAMLGSTGALTLASATAQETVIDDARTEPVLTSVVSDPTIRGEDAGITVTDRSALVIDADATVIQDGAIVVNGAGADVAGVRVTGDVTGSYEQAGSIVLDTERQVTLTQDQPDFAAGRYGFLVEEAASLTGNVSFEDGSTVLVETAGGAGIGILGDLDGDLSVGGTVTTVGEGAAAVEVDGAVSGGIAFGQAALLRGVGVDADGLRLGGSAQSLAFDGIARATAYTTAASGFILDPANPTEGSTAIDQATLSASGNAVSLTGDLAQGAVFGGNSTLSVRGAGAGLFVGGGAMLGLPVDDPGTDGDEATGYGLQALGSISAEGVVDGVSAAAIVVEDATIAGGIRIEDAVNATARGLDVDAVAVRLGAGADVAEISNDGAIFATATTDQGDAVAIRDLSGSVTRFVNTGDISASLGDYVDAADTTNTDPTDDGTPSGRRIAIDLSANTTGVDVLNTFLDRTIQNSAGEDVTIRDFGRLFGDVLTGSGNDRFAMDAGGVLGDVVLGAGDDEVAISGGSTLAGDLLLGDGFDTIALSGTGSRITGTVDFGGDAGAFLIEDGARFAGTIAGSGATALTVGGGGEFALDAGEAVFVGSLTTTAALPAEEGGEARSAILSFSVADDGSDVSTINAAGDVTLSGDTRIETVIGAAFDGDVDAALVTTGGVLNADLGALSATLAENTPFLFDAALFRGDDQSLRLGLSRKDAAAAGVDPALAPAFEPVLAALVGAKDEDRGDAAEGGEGLLLRSADERLGGAVFNLRTREEFLGAFEQFLGGPLDAPLTYAQVQNNSVTSLVTSRVESLREGFGRERTAWLQEQTYYVDRGADEVSRGFDGGGFVIALGADAPIGPIDTVGIVGSIASARYDEQRGNDFPFNRLTYSGGVYAAERIGRVLIDGRASYGAVTSESERVIIVGETETVTGERRALTADWDGTEIAAHGRVRYEGKLGRWDVQPFASLDYLNLQEDAYTEEGSPLDANYALTVEDREATSLRANGGLTLGRSYELTPRAFDTTIPGVIAPRLTAAWSQELDTDDFEATYRIADGEAFTLMEEKEAGAAIVGADLLYENQYAHLMGGVSASFGEDTTAYTVRLGLGLKW